MRFKIKRRQLFIIIIIFLVLIIVAIVFTHNLRDISNRGFPYENFLEFCELEEDGSKLNCKGLIYQIEENDERKCFDMVFMTPEYTFKEDLLCANSNDISWEDQVPVSTEYYSTVLVYFTINYKKTIFNSYKISSINLSLIPDEEIYGIIDKLSENGLPLPNIRTKKFTEIVQKGYYLDNRFHEIVDDKRISSLTFYFVEVEKVSNKGNKIVIDGRVEILDNEYNFEVEADSFLYVPVNFSSNENSIIINSDNLEEYPNMEGSFQMRYYYVGSEEDINEDDIFNYCTREDLTLGDKVFCDNIINNKFGEINTIEDYIIQITESNAILNFDELTLVKLFEMYDE